VGDASGRSRGTPRSSAKPATHSAISSSTVGGTGPFGATGRGYTGAGEVVHRPVGVQAELGPRGDRRAPPGGAWTSAAAASSAGLDLTPPGMAPSGLTMAVCEECKPPSFPGGAELAQGLCIWCLELAARRAVAAIGALGCPGAAVTTVYPLGLNFWFPTECNGPYGGVAEALCLMLAQQGADKCSLTLQGRLGNSTYRSPEGVWQCEGVRHGADVFMVVNAKPGTLEALALAMTARRRAFPRRLPRGWGCAGR